MNKQNQGANMMHDPKMRAAARAIYDACYPCEEWAVRFDEAERHRTIHYRQACDAALQAMTALADPGEQLALFGLN